MQQRGTVIKWKDEEGYGFIRPDSGGEEVFLHVTAILRRGERRPDVGARINYFPGRDDRGRPVAIQPSYEGEKYTPRETWDPTPPPPRPHGSHASNRAVLTGLSIFISASFLVGLVLATFAVPILPWWILAVYIAMSGVMVGAYAMDKQAAEAGTWRTPESTLLIQGLLCGWPGALVAQHIWRHKSSKAAYQSLFRFTIFANLAGFLVLFLSAPQFNQAVTHALGRERAKSLVFPDRLPTAEPVASLEKSLPPPAPAAAVPPAAQQGSTQANLRKQPKATAAPTRKTARVQPNPVKRKAQATAQQAAPPEKLYPAQSSRSRFRVDIVDAPAGRW